MCGDRAAPRDNVHEEVPDSCTAFESALADVANRLANVPDGQFDATITTSLRQLAELFGFDRSSLLAFSPDGGSLRVTHTWAAVGVPSIEVGWPVEDKLAWLAGQIREGHIVRIGGAKDLPAEAEDERTYILGCGLKSAITIPLIVDENVNGAISFGTFRTEQHWPPGICIRLRLVGEVMGLAVDRKHSADRLKELLQMLNGGAIDPAKISAARVEQLRRLAVHLIKARDRERRRIGEALHEDVMQVLAGVRILLESSGDRDPSEQSAAISRGAETLREATQTLRKLLVDMRPHMLYDTGISAAISWLANKNRETCGLVVRVCDDGAVDPVREDIRVFLYEAARELLANVATHGCTGQASLDIRRIDSDHVRLSVSDDGAGFDPAQLAEIPSDRFGLFGIREITELLGGKMELQSAPGRGTRVSLTIQA